MKKIIIIITSIAQLININGQSPLIATSKYTFLTGKAKLTDSAQYFIEKTRYTTPFINSNIALNFDSTIIYSDGGQAGISRASKVERKYNESNKILEEAKYKIGSNAWLKDTRQLFAYDQYGNNNIVVNQFGYLNEWNNLNKQSKVFDNLGRVITTTNYDGLGFTWTFHDSTINTYSAIGPPNTSLSFTQINNNIIANKRSGFISSNIKLYEIYNFQTGVWDKTSRVTFFTDSTLYESYSNNNGWYYTAATAITMGATKSISEREYYYNGVNFVFSKRSTYGYHNNDERYLLYYLYENPLPQNEMSNIYDDNNNVVQTDQTIYQNGNYVNTVRTINYYTNNLLTKRYILNINLNTLVSDSLSKTEYTYENGQIREEEHRLYDKQTNSFELISGSYIQNFYYKNTASTSQINMNKNNYLQVFPNPSNSFINFEITPQGSQTLREIRIFDLKGQLINVVNYNEKITSIKSFQFDVSTYPKGVYAVSMVFNEKIENTKIIIQ